MISRTVSRESSIILLCVITTRNILSRPWPCQQFCKRTVLYSTQFWHSVGGVELAGDGAAMEETWPLTEREAGHGRDQREATGLRVTTHQATPTQASHRDTFHTQIIFNPHKSHYKNNKKFCSIKRLTLSLFSLAVPIVQFPIIFKIFSN